MPSINNLYLSQALDAILDPIFIVGASGECAFANQAFSALLKFDPERLPHLVAKFWPAYESTRVGSEIVTEFLTAASEVVKVKLASAKLGDGFVSFTVVSSLLAGAGSLAASRKLETLGMLAGGVAHDFNNILAGLVGHITYLRSILPAHGAHAESIAALEEGSKRAAAMTAAVLSFSRSEEGEKPTAIDMGDFATRTCRLLKGALTRDYPIDVVVPTSPLFVLGVEALLTQTLCNLVMNAKEASQSGSKITVTVEEETNKQLLTKLFGEELSSASYVSLRVADSGSGIAPDVMSRVFEPFFTTKKGKGTGLGMSTVQDAVKNLGGSIDIESVVGKGTVITVVLPRVVKGDIDPQARRAEGKQRLEGGDERILIIDDDYPVRGVLQLTLEHLGYKVSVASSGLDGLGKYKMPGDFDLVLLDMVMPHMSGEEVYGKLRQVDPNARVVLISGYTTEASIKNVLSNGGKGFIAKPFTIEVLAKTVREVLDTQ